MKGDEDKTLSEIGIDFSSNKERTTIKLLPSNSKMQRRSAIVAEADSASYNSMQDEELPMGATADSPLHNKRVSIYACKKIPYFSICSFPIIRITLNSSSSSSFPLE